MITLITYPAMGPLFSLSPFCCKAAMMLTYARVDWQREDSEDPRRAPHGKLPAIRVDTGEVIGDTDAIRQFLERQGIDFCPGQTDLEKSFGRALIRMAEEHLYFHLVLDRWGRDDVWPTIRDTYFQSIPSPFRKLVANGLRKSLLRGLTTQGIARFPEKERFGRADQDLVAIGNAVNERGFLVGDTLSLADFSVAPVLDAMRHTPLETPLSVRVRDDAVLAAYIERVNRAVTGTGVFEKSDVSALE